MGPGDLRSGSGCDQAPPSHRGARVGIEASPEDRVSMPARTVDPRMSTTRGTGVAPCHGSCCPKPVCPVAPNIQQPGARGRQPGRVREISSLWQPGAVRDWWHQHVTGWRMLGALVVLVGVSVPWLLLIPGAVWRGEVLESCTFEGRKDNPDVYAITGEEHIEWFPPAWVCPMSDGSVQKRSVI